MNSLDSMLRRNQDFAAQQSAGASAYASGAAECEGNHHRLR